MLASLTFVLPELCGRQVGSVLNQIKNQTGDNWCQIRGVGGQDARLAPDYFRPTSIAVIYEVSNTMDIEVLKRLKKLNDFAYLEIYPEY